MFRGYFVVIIVAGLLLSLPRFAFSQTERTPAVHRPFISPIFGDNMVMQRGKANTIWGWSDPGDRVQVEIFIRCGRA